MIASVLPEHSEFLSPLEVQLSNEMGSKLENHYSLPPFSLKTFDPLRCDHHKPFK